MNVAVFGLGGAASADSFHSVKFSASGTGASAGWASGAGSQITLTVGSPPDTTFALAQLTSESGKEAGTTVKRVDVIADGDQNPGTTDTITCLQFNNLNYTTCN